jgi:hypothetical protein
MTEERAIEDTGKHEAIPLMDASSMSDFDNGR